MAPAVEITVVTELKDCYLANSSLLHNVTTETFNGFYDGKIVLEFYGFQMGDYLERDFVWLLILTLFYTLQGYSLCCSDAQFTEFLCKKGRDPAMIER